MIIERINAAKSARWTTWVGLILVPVLVLGGLLWATWNSDERLDTVRAAVVNQDEAVELGGQLVPMGRQLTAALVDSDRLQNLTWEQATLDGAKAGLKTGEYAAMVVIPKEFSAAATSYAGDAAQARSATIQVETSPVAGIADATLGKVVAQEAAQVLNQTLTSGYLDQIYVGFNEMGDQFVTMSDAAAQLSDGANGLSDGAGQLSDGIGQAAAGAGELASGASQAATGAQQYASGVGEYAAGVNEYAAGISTLASQVQAMPDGMTQLADGASQLSDGVGQYVDGINQMVNPVIDVLAANPGAVDAIQQISGDQEGLDDAVATMRQVQAGVQQLEALNQLSPAELAQVFGCPSDLEAVEGGCDSYYQAIKLGIASANQTMDDVRSDEKLGPVIEQLDALPDQLAAIQLPDGGINLLDTMTELRDGGEALKSGASELAGGVGELATGVQPLVDGVNQLADGANQLSSGAGQLADGANQLSDGMSQLSSGVGQFADGVNQLADGGTQLADGTTQLSDGIGQFADGLASGKDQVPSFSDSDRQRLSEVVSSPVATGNLLGTATVGMGWATTLMVLALWAGAMATFMVVKALGSQLRTSARPTTYLVAEALLPGVIVVAIQSLAVTAIGQAALDLPFGRLMGVLGVMVLAGLAFVAVNHALVAWLGSAGRFISLGLVIVGLAPMLTNALPGVFATARAISPMSPALDAMRSVITQSSGTPASVFLLLMWLILGLAASAAAVIKHRTTTIDDLVDA